MEECSVSLKRVMAPLDLSTYSEDTFVYALNLAESLGAELVVLNVVNSKGLEALDLVAAQGYAVSRESYIEKVQEEREKQFQQEFMARCGRVPARLIFRVGLPYEEILKAIAAENIDLVVMGTKGRTNLSGALFGTTAEKVYRRATCAVVSIRGPEHCRLPEK
jgi:nucleotide-binding universal stress UspA family protein